MSSNGSHGSPEPSLSANAQSRETRVNSFFDQIQGENDVLELELSTLPAVNFALIHNRVPVLRHLRLRNVGDKLLRDLAVSIELHGHDGPLADPWHREIASLAPQTPVAWADLSEFALHAKALSQTNEAFNATLEITARHPWDQPLRLARPLRVLAHNEWLATPALFETIAAFVQPNAAVIAEVLREAADILRTTTGDSAIVGYQRGPARAIETAGAIYEALRARELVYAPAPSSFENTGQRIRTPQSTLEERLGNCVDLTVTYAACLEQAGLHPLVCIVEGHAFAAFHRDEERLPEAVLLDTNSMVNLVDTGHVIPVEMTAIGASEEARSFPEAASMAQTHFQDTTSLRGLVDVRLAHRSGIDPLPTRDDATVVPIASPDRDAPVGPDQDLLTDTTGLTAAAVQLPENLREAVLGEADEAERVYEIDDSAPPRVQRWRQALLDLSLRNPLLNLPRSRSRGLDLHVPAGALAVLDDLIHAHKSLRIHSIDDLTALRGLRPDAEVAPETLVSDLQNEHRLYGAVATDSYHDTMRGLQRAARTVEQETGSNYLYLTLGALVHPSPSGREARAPLFVIPVRIEGGSGKSPYTLVVDGQELAAPNYCLIEWLRVRHAVTIPQLSEPILDDSGIDIARTLAAIKESLVEHQLNYRVDELASLRLLQFSTFQMWRDLTDNWQQFMTNSVVEHLIERPGQPFADPADSGDPVVVDESDLHLPIAADGSQMEAIAMAEAGRSFVLEGPPGTGKSQTITNLILRLIARGKSVLFVAEKQAALEVVKRRIDALGLTPFVLDLHGRRQTMRSIREQLKRGLEHHTDSDAVGWEAAALDFSSRLASLQAYPQALHEPNAAEVSAWTAHDSLLAYEEGPALDVPRVLMDKGPEVHRDIEVALEGMPEKVRLARPHPRHRWSLAGSRSFDEADADQLQAAARALETARTNLGSAPLLKGVTSKLDGPQDASFIAEYLNGVVPSHAVDPAAVEHAAKSNWDSACLDVIAGIEGFRERNARALGHFAPSAFNDELVAAWAGQAEAASRGIFGKRRRQEALIAKLTPYLQPNQTVAGPELLALVEALRAATAEASALTVAACELPGIELPSGWSAVAPDAIETLQESIGTLVSARELRERLPNSWQAIVQLPTQEPKSPTLAGEVVVAWETWGNFLSISEETTQQWAGEDSWFEAWANDGPRWSDELEREGLRPLRAWASLQSALDVLRENGMAGAATEILDGHLPGEGLLAAFRRGRARTALDERLAAHGLDLFDGNGRNSEVDRFLAAADGLRNRVATQMATELAHRREAEQAEHERRFGELKKQLDRKRGGMSFRELFLEYAEEILTIAPCILTSPASVATFLAPDAGKFDVAIFDEASQIRVPQAIGALGRAKAAVIVGDSRQMPPTSVMEVSREDAEDDPTVPEDLESILSEAVESGLEQRWLSWHYRSRIEDLIAFSNRHYYDSKLSSLPSPGPIGGTGIGWRRVDGTYARGGARNNAVEAEAIVAEIHTRLRSPLHSQESIGVVTFNVQQRDLILDRLEESEDDLVQAALSRDDGEAIFVKNLENVQGDERDTILFSLAFSKDPASGRLPLNFGPLVSQGGERRLNVAVTRARSSVVLFSSFDPQEIDLGRTTSIGIAHLRAYMELAVGGAARLGDLRAGSATRANRLLDELGAELERHDLEVEKGVGLSDFQVDLAVRKAGRELWQVAVLSDGPRWANRPTAADRHGAPRLLSELMHWHAWTMAWLPEWVRDRDAVVGRVVSLVDDADRAALTKDAADPLEADDLTQVQTIAAKPGAPTSRCRDTGARDANVGRVAPEPLQATQTTQSRNTSSELGLSPAPGEPFRPFEPRQIGTRAEIDQLAHSERTQASVRSTLHEIVNQEGPVQIDRLVRLALNCFGFNRVGTDRAAAVIPLVPSERCIERPADTFVWPGGTNADTWRGYRTTQNPGDRAFADVCPEEIGNAMLHVLSVAPKPLTEEELFRRSMTALGYRRLTDGIRSDMDQALAMAIQTGRVVPATDRRFRPGA